MPDKIPKKLMLLTNLLEATKRLALANQNKALTGRHHIAMGFNPSYVRQYFFLILRIHRAFNIQATLG